MSETAPSPAVEQLAWGRVRVAGHGEMKDAKLYPGGAREWDWGETGTSHRPGIQPEDVEELLEHGARVVVLATGMYRRLGVREDTLEMLERRGVEVHVEESREAVRLYERLRRERPVGCLLHSTC